MRGLLIAIVTSVLSTAASAETGTYVFVPDQSELVQTGGIASVHWTYSVEGDFGLAIDPNAGTASFTRVDANATDDSPFKRALDPNQVFNMTSLVGTVLEDGTIEFTGKASDGSDILITVALTDDLAQLIGQTTPPPNSADFFIFEIDAVAQRKYAGGSGTAEDPYQIATAEDLILLGETPEDYDKHFILTGDIDLDQNLPGGTVFDRAVIGAGWQPPFTGVFDGNSHVISHLKITRGRPLGLFGRLGSGAEVKNLGVVDVKIHGPADSVGGLVGINDGQVTRCYSTGTVSGDAIVGGLVGRNSGGTVTTCYSTGAVSGYSAIGGLIGRNSGGTVTMCYSTGAVSGDYDSGGLVGCNSGGTVTTCYSTGAVSGYKVSGGLVGSNGGDLTNCCSAGAVSGYENVGGLVGHNSARISASYSTGAVAGNEEVGGFVGSNAGTGSIATSFWDIQTSGEPNMCGSQGWNATGCDANHGKTTAEMQTASTFLEAEWDLINVWGIGENQTYPYLRKYSAADINEDGSVDFGDLAILADNWLGSIAP